MAYHQVEDVCLGSTNIPREGERVNRSSHQSGIVELDPFFKTLVQLGKRQTARQEDGCGTARVTFGNLFRMFCIPLARCFVLLVGFVNFTLDRFGYVKCLPSNELSDTP